MKTSLKVLLFEDSGCCPEILNYTLADKDTWLLLIDSVGQIIITACNYPKNFRCKGLQYLFFLQDLDIADFAGLLQIENLLHWSYLPNFKKSLSSINFGD